MLVVCSLVCIVVRYLMVSLVMRLLVVDGLVLRLLLVKLLVLSCLVVNKLCVRVSDTSMAIKGQMCHL